MWITLKISNEVMGFVKYKIGMLIKIKPIAEVIHISQALKRVFN